MQLAHAMWIRGFRIIACRLAPLVVLTLVWSRPVIAQATTYVLEHREWAATGFVGASFLESGEFPTTVFGTDEESSETVGMSYRSGYQVGMRITDETGYLPMVR